MRVYDRDSGPYGGACSPGFVRSHAVAKRMGGNGACEYRWASSSPTDCRVWRMYSRAGSSSLQCSFTVYEKRELEHPDPLCRPSGC